MRKHGLAADNLIAADLVTADGRLVHASQDENADLLWGLRGGGGNFGVVTSLEYQLHEVGPMITGGGVFYPADKAADVLRVYRDWVGTAPDELTTLVNLLTCPPAPFLPEDWHGKPLVAVIGLHAGSADAAERALRPLREHQRLARAKRRGHARLIDGARVLVGHQEHDESHVGGCGGDGADIKPGSRAASAERPPGLSPTTTRAPLSRRLRAWAWPWLPYPMMAKVRVARRRRSASAS